MHIHDEVVLETEPGEAVMKDVDRIMSEPINWGKGLPLKAESYQSLFYRKD